METIEQFHLWRLNIPLKKPYRLSFGDQISFDCVFVHLLDSQGRSGWGEATLLPGYTDETVEDAWGFAKSFARELIHKSVEDVASSLDALPQKRAFSACAFRTALEYANNHSILSAQNSVPLLGAINEKPENRETLEAEIEGLIATGYKTLKVKVGFDVNKDLDDITLIKKMVSGRAQLRIDANQGYSKKDGMAFVTMLGPEDIELVEQPCHAADWDAAVATKQVSQVPLMLDESIYGFEDITRAADLGCADYIKLKLMKMSGLDRLIEGIKLIRSSGMRPVLGNGVATDLGCWMEACVAAQYIDNAGEMNGFLRPTASVFAQPMATDGPAILLDGILYKPDTAKLDEFATDYSHLQC